jgi:hypothetical protein
MINLFINPYIHNNSERQKELDFCMKQNRENRFIDRIYEIYGRPSYRDYFKKINEVTTEDDINIIANADIFFDETIIFAENMRHNNCYLLSRWDIKSIKPFEAHVYNQPGSQDVWMFRGKVRDIKYCDFPLGKMGCDNRIARELHVAGYALVNCAYTIRSYHYHLTEIRTYDQSIRNAQTVVPPPYQYVSLSALKEIHIQHIREKYKLHENFA